MAGVEIIRRAFDAFAQDGGETLIRSCRLEVEMHAVTNFVADREAYRGPEELCQRRVPGRSRVVRPDLRWNLEL